MKKEEIEKLKMKAYRHKIKREFEDLKSRAYRHQDGNLVVRVIAVDVTLKEILTKDDKGE